MTAVAGRTGAGARRRGVRRAAHAATACLAAVLLAACSSVPTSGPIEQGPVVDSGEATQFVRVIAAPPSSGASPEEIVRGFLEANASLENDLEIARRYLTEEAAEQWNPQEGTTTYDQATLKVAPARDKVRVEFGVDGELLADGTFDTVAPPVDREVLFSLERVVEGKATVPQWRISDPPPGVLISSTDLRRAYRLYQTYFMAERGGVLVPDGRLLPVVGPSLPTALAERVLAGPADWLAPGIRPGPPMGTHLALGAVTVTDGVAQVELSEEALVATDEQRQDLAADLTWTLTGLPDVAAVELLVAGEPYEVPGAPTLMDRSVWQSRSPDSRTTGSSGERRVPYYTLRGESIVRVTTVSRTAIPIGVPGAETLAGLAVSLDEKRAAAIERGGGALWLLPLDRSTTASRVEGTGITSVGFDVDDWVWFTEGGRVMRTNLSGQVKEVPILTEGVSGVTSLMLARDGTRVALIADGAVHMGVVQVRGATLAIGSVRRIGSSIEQAADAAWRDATTLDVLGSQVSGAEQVLRLAVGSGQVLALGAPDSPREVAASPGSMTMVANGDGDLFGNVGLQWRPQGSARSVTYPE